MHFLQFTIFLMTLVFITFFTLLLSLFYKFLHIDKKQYILICILSISMLVHKMILKFPYMYVTYTILIILWLFVLLYTLLCFFKKKAFLQTLFILVVFLLSIFFPTFGNLRQYYVYKPIFILRSYSILENNNYLPYLSFMTGKKVFVLKNKVYYELGKPSAFDNTGGLVITFDEPPSKTDWNTYIFFEKIDTYAYFYTRHK